MSVFYDHRFCFAYIYLMKNDQVNQVANNNPSSARFLAPIVLKFHHPRDRELQKRGTVIFYKDVFGLPYAPPPQWGIGIRVISSHDRPTR